MSVERGSRSRFSRNPRGWRMLDIMETDQIVDPDGSPPWLHLLSALQRDWREKQILKGRNPDAYIQSQLVEAGRWLPNPTREDVSK
ncbi:hypothetical protein G3T14_21930 [Methylobacterium sp. BTF04]|uniref:hypothetical protein n=1 Tax=Methylobacterium sp. BTF04 TaxID=2708300 RepID=UPI0013D066EA|nr:hypothetical protein [Methylobacterium sp. BTF04]NEU14741.1 hypothetical protein [Methylobacterium sp. BTF04]